MKKLLSLLLVFCMIAGMMAILPISAAEQEDTTDFNDGTWTKITTAEDFKNMEKDGKYYLGNDISFKDVERLWETVKVNNVDTSVLTASYATRDFAGTLDGNGYSLLDINIESDGDIGLFNANFHGTLKNVTIGSSENPAKITASGQGKAVSVVARTIQGGAATFENVTIYGDIQTVNGDGTKTSKTGMFTGYIASSSNATFTNCHVYGTVSGAAASGFVTSCRNQAPTIAFVNCSNNATVSNNGKNNDSRCMAVAGFYANTWEDGTTKDAVTLSFDNCVNNGTITANLDNRDKNSAAGFVCLNSPLKFDLSFNNCTNNATITTVGGAAAGLFSVRNDGKNETGSSIEVNGCKNNGDIIAMNTTVASSCAGLVVLPRYDAPETTVVIKNSINTATVAGGKGSAGGIFNLQTDENSAGTVIDVTIIGCANLGAVSATDWRAGGICGAIGFNVNTKLVMKNCYNAGSVTNPNQTAAGLIGEAAMPGAIVNEWLITNCYNSGALSAGRVPAIARSQHGVDSKLIVKNCAYTGTVGYDGTGATETNVQGGQVAESILSIVNTDIDPETGSTFVPDTFGINGGYPLLSWQIPASASTPSFSNGNLDYDTNTISTEGVTGYVSARVNGDKSDLRFVLAVDLTAVATYEDLSVTVEFCDITGVVKSFTLPFEKLTFYKSATAAGNTYTAAEGDALFGLVVTGVPNNAWNYVVLSVQTSADSAMHGVGNQTIVNP